MSTALESVSQSANQSIMAVVDRLRQDPHIQNLLEKGSRRSIMDGRTLHGRAHAERVMKSAVDLAGDIRQSFPANILPEAKMRVAAVGAYLHDLGQAHGRKNHEFTGAEEARKALRRMKIMSEEEIQEVGELIANHRVETIVKKNRGIISLPHALLVIADKCAGGSERVCPWIRFKLRILRLACVPGTSWSLARCLFVGDRQDQINWSIKETRTRISPRMEKIHEDFRPGEETTPVVGTVVHQLKVDEGVVPVNQILNDKEWFADSFQASHLAARYFGCRFQLQFNCVPYEWNEGSGEWEPYKDIPHLQKKNVTLV